MMPLPGAQEVGMRHQFTTTRAVRRPRRGHPSDAGLDLAGEAYRGLVAIVSGLDDEQGWAPTGCAGWCVRDLVAHLLDDVRRGLVALGTPAGGPPDTDRIRYWATWRPGSDVGRLERRAVRTVASLYTSIVPLAVQYAEAATALCGLGELLSPDAVVRTQGRALRVDDLFHTLAVEATVHHADLTVHLDVPGPGAPGLGAVRVVLDGLLGGATPVPWDDLAYLRAGTGRARLTPAERDLLGPDAARFPLFG
jgi:hypothetical protein